MSKLTPTNELDRAIMAAQRSRAGMPGLYRQLAAGELWFLVPFHPEVEGGMIELKNGSPLLFARLLDEQGEVVLLYSSEARLEEGLRKGGLSASAYSAGSMPARQVLGIVGGTGLRAVINKGCATGQVVIPPDLMRDLADGTALQSSPPEAAKRGRIKILNPADYPTNLIQPVFEFMRRHPNFRAAWVFGSTPGPEQAVTGRCYQLLILMSPRDERLVHDLNVTVQAARAREDEVGLGLLDETDAAYIGSVFRQAPAFYTAADYRPPPAPPPGS